MDFNINDNVMVKLTGFGRQKLRENHDHLFLFISPEYLEKHPYKPVKEDKDGWSKWQLWHLMEELGQYCHLGMNDQPFNTNIKIVATPKE